MKIWLLPFFTFLFFTGCSTMQVSSDHDPEFSFASLHTYAVADQKPKKGSDLGYKHLVRALNNGFTKMGYTKTTKEKADFYLLVHVDIKDISEVETNYEYAHLEPYPYRGYGTIPPSRPYPDQQHRRPYIDPYDYNRLDRTRTSTYEYQEGKLIVDAYDPKSKQVIWRGIAEDIVPEHISAEEKIAYINKVVQKILETFPGYSESGK